VSENIEPIGSEASSGVSRRTVTKAMAWAVPVIAVSAAVPAYAASGGILQLDGRGCKAPGRSNDTYKGYLYGFRASNPFNAQITITINSIDLNGTDLGDVLIIDLSTCQILGTNSFTLAPLQTASNLVVITQNAANSSQGTLNASYTVSGVPQGGTFTPSAPAPTVPPFQGNGSCTAFTRAEKLCMLSLAL
jgi:hypothetical protein